MTYLTKNQPTTSLRYIAKCPVYIYSKNYVADMREEMYILWREQFDYHYFLRSDLPHFSGWKAYGIGLNELLTFENAWN